MGSFLGISNGQDTSSDSKVQRKELKLPPVRKDAKYAPDEWSQVLGQAENSPAGLYEGFRSISFGPKQYNVVGMEFRDAASCQAFNVEGTHVISRFERFADAFVPVDQATLNAVGRAPGLVWMDYMSSPVTPPPSPVKPEEGKSRQQPAQIVRGGLDGLTGKGVVIAILDTGVDFRHPDFITYDEQGRPTSRLLAFWDTNSELHAYGDVGSPAPVTYPNGAPIGTVYSREDLTAELRRSKLRIPVSDMNGHGTACASVAAGNGNASDGENVGVAPGADLIAVRLGGDGRRDPPIQKAWLLGAICDWLNSVVDKRPLVISCSFGGHWSGHDGYRVREREVSARFPLTGRGRAICIAAGNEGVANIHASTVLNKADGPKTISWKSAQGANVRFFAQTDSLDGLKWNYSGTAEVKEYRPYVNRLSGHTIVAMAAGPGTGQLTLTCNADRSIQIDAYLLGGRRDGFTGGTSSMQGVVGSPGCSHHAITVASYNWNDEFSQHGRPYVFPDVARPDVAMTIGSLSAYSSAGPLRFGDVLKPDICAPGQWHASAIPLNVAPYQARHTNGFYQPFNGTSAATPYTAGVVALLMEKKPDLTLGEIKELLKTGATSDRFTGPLPNPRWGNGKLDAAAVRQMVDALENGSTRVSRASAIDKPRR
jgi:subtilisin family serine protease